MRALASRLARLRARDERGYIAALVAIMFPVVFIALAAIAVDTARWYVEVQRVQNAADAGSLAGVIYMPQDLPTATSTAKTVTSRNGFTDGVGGVTVSAEQGTLSTQLKVTVTSTIKNTFGAAIGAPTTTVSRSSTSDYTGPAPMGSPCPTFGNEPTAGGGVDSPAPTGSVLGSAPYANCGSAPQFWAVVEGPDTDKIWGDRYSTTNCTSAAVNGCTGTTNDEYNKSGYFWYVRVADDMVGKPITVQLYDPAFVLTGQTCGSLPLGSGFANNMNPYVTTDAAARYGRNPSNAPTGASYCTGDIFPDANSAPMTTSFAVRAPTDKANPLAGAVISGCTKQYGASNVPTVSSLQAKNTDGTANTGYNKSLAQVFHNWTNLCSFTPTESGDYYLQVRTNVTTTGGSAAANSNGMASLIYSGNSAVTAANGNTTGGDGINAFGIRAVTPTGFEKSVSVSGYDRMPIWANSTASTQVFNLIRVLPGARGQFISFQAFDLGDATGNGTVTIVPPSDATGSITTTPFPSGCRARGGYAGTTGTTSTTCSFTVNNTSNNGRFETFSVPIPTDYTCTSTSNGGCWYQVKISFPSGAVNDVTTWNATIDGDPVRLIK